MFFFFQAEDGIRDGRVTGVQTCALPICPKRVEVLNSDEKRRTAYHEAGHTLVSYYEPEADPPQKVTIVPRGRAGGVTFIPPDEERFHHSLEFFKARLMVLMGGRAAERLVFAQPYAGVEEDLKQA